jgi:CheY-like chemotaxis protein
MDLHMPEMDGYETTETIRLLKDDKKKNIPIIALTAAAIKGEKEKCLAAGMDDYISKPFEPEDLFKKIDENLKGITTPVQSNKKPLKTSKVVNQNNTAYKYINLSYLNSIGGDDPQFQNELLTIFKEQIPILSKQLYNALHTKKYDELGAIAHKAKSSVAMLGIKSLKQMMEQLELNAKNKQKIETYSNLVDEFNRISILVLEEIKDLKF